MIDHIGIRVRDIKKSKTFYSQALAPLGYTLSWDLEGSEYPNGLAGFALKNSEPNLWIHGGTPNNPPIHIAFGVKKRSLVDAFYKAALAAGGKDNGPPGLRPDYHPDYYAAFIHDPDGHNIEAVCMTHISKKKKG